MWEAETEIPAPQSEQVTGKPSEEPATEAPIPEKETENQTEEAKTEAPALQPEEVTEKQTEEPAAPEGATVQEVPAADPV
uniref:Uncharacterized protein n=1 Tax=Trichuris muris TaxID=70415 RepID=A0A5S6PYH9_TRIMR